MGVGWQIGGGGAGVGFTASASASSGMGNAEGESTTYTNTHVRAGEHLSIESGGDTVLAGAVVSADRVEADIGGDLRIESEYASVGKQSGIRAGDGGFDVKVWGKTVLKGGAITGTQVAVDEQRNGFESEGGVELQDVHNEARYEARSSSTTRAGISNIAGHKDARTGDAETGLAPIFGRETVSDEVRAQVVINEGSSGRCSRTCMAEL